MAESRMIIMVHKKKGETDAIFLILAKSNSPFV
jgi:hypothetical protein